MQKHVEIDEPEEDHEIEIGAQTAWPVDIGPAMEIEGDEVDEEGDEEPEVDEDLPEDMLQLSDEEAAGLADDTLPDPGEVDTESGARKR